MKDKTSIHLAIIPDGNRRWAKNHGLNPWKGHKKAIENLRSITEWCRNDPRISILTVWCFSTENWKRDPKEIERIFSMLEDYLRKEKGSFIEKQTRFCHSGRKDRIPRPLAALMNEIEEQTKGLTEFTLNLAVDYGGRDEIERMAKKIQRSAAEIHGSTDLTTGESPLQIRDYLDHPELPNIDLVIRTSGEQRTSNFFMWQAAYAEWIFNEKMFPDFGISDLEDALKEYELRGRRYGS